ncbi:MAG: ACT domain-containing protein [Candidatus Gracilibacteria bacterium]|jgi:hypothetical protein
MKGISDINILLKSMNPKLRKGEYIFAVVTKNQAKTLNPVMTFEEEEGETVVIDKQEADAKKISYDSSWKLITLTIHSDLQAVGLIAAISNKLAESEMSINVVSAFYHDHLFVSPERSEEAMQILKNISA